MGPATAAAVRAAAPSLFVDVHLGVAQPARHVAALGAALAGRGRITFQYEALEVRAARLTRTERRRMRAVMGMGMTT